MAKNLLCIGNEHIGEETSEVVSTGEITCITPYTNYISVLKKMNIIPIKQKSVHISREKSSWRAVSKAHECLCRIFSKYLFQFFPCWIVERNTFNILKQRSECCGVRHTIYKYCYHNDNVLWFLLRYYCKDYAKLIFHSYFLHTT